MNWGTGFYRDPFAFKNTNITSTAKDTAKDTNGRKYLQMDGQTNYQRSLRPKKNIWNKRFSQSELLIIGQSDVQV